jgi:unspecific monooxygenase
MSISQAYDSPVAAGSLVPPTPPRAPEDIGFFARINAMRDSVITAWGQRAYEEEILHSRFLTRSTFILNRPDTIRHVLVDNDDNYTRTPGTFRVLRPLFGLGILVAEGSTWKQQRRTWAPAFTPRFVSTLVPQMISSADEAVAKLDSLHARPVDARDVMQEMMLKIVGRTMFSFEMDRHGATLRKFVVKYAERMARPHLLDQLFPPSFPSPLDFARARFRKQWTQFVSLLIAERRARGKSEGAPPGDLFDLLAAARDPNTGAPASEELLRDEIATMFLAGHETTANTMFWALYLLALDLNTQDQVAAEVKDAPINDAADVERLKFTRATIDETLRLYPPTFLIARAAIGPDTVAGIPVRKHDFALVVPWVLHRHEKLWHDPNAFIPSRFLPPSPPPDRFSFLPFGAGPRVCVGAHFAQLAATLALAKLIARFRFSLLDNRPVIPVGVITTQPDHSPMFAITPR